VTPMKGKVREPPGDPFTSDSIISVASHLPLPPPGIERACTRYMGVGHEEGYQNAASTDITYVIHDTGHAVWRTQLVS